MIEPYLPDLADGEDKSSPLKNRIRKNYRHVRKWAKRTKTDAFRIYDRDIKEHPFAIDYFAGKFSVHYWASRSEEDEVPEKHIDSCQEALTSLFGCDPGSIFWRTRIRRKKVEQYEKREARQEFFEVFENGLKFFINLEDYLDTGLFLDHRKTRELVGGLSQGKRVLNLFAYTGAFSVYAAAHGARQVVTVDMSNTYLSWAEENFRLNGIFLEGHPCLRADCMKYLEEAPRRGELFDVIVLDPPTLSRSKKMEEMFDIERDWPYLIGQCKKLLHKDGVLIFSTNFRSFELDEGLFPELVFEEITKRTHVEEFRDGKIRFAWRVNWKALTP